MGAAKNISELSEAYEHAKSVAKTIGQERFNSLAELTKKKKAEFEKDAPKEMTENS